MKHAVVLSLLALASPAAELVVGPGGAYGRIEEAVAAAREGDVVLVRAREGGAPYERTAVWIDKPRITLRGDPGSARRIPLSGAGFEYTGRGFVPRAIVQFNRGAAGCVLENFELYGAHNASHNGSGVRINQAGDVTIRNCEIRGCDMGIMSNGDGTTDSGRNQLIENCLIHHNGDRTEPGYNHNLYLGGAGVKLTGCDIHSSLTGHNVKSRAHRLEVRDCRVHDSANREFDLVDAAETGFPDSDAILVSNVIAKATNCPGNRGVIHFGTDTGKPRHGALRLEGNTISTPFLAPVVLLSSPGTRVELLRNVVLNSGSQRGGQVLVDAKASTAARPVEGTGNRLAPAFGGPALDALGLKDTTIAGASPAEK